MVKQGTKEQGGIGLQTAAGTGFCFRNQRKAKGMREKPEEFCWL
jgi:hypothetical protein